MNSSKQVSISKAQLNSFNVPSVNSKQKCFQLLFELSVADVLS